MFFDKSKSENIASLISREFGGKIEKCNASFGLKTCKYCVKLEYDNMKMEVYVFYPYFEIWIKNFHIKEDVLFSINQSKASSGLMLPVKRAFKNYDIPVFTNSAYNIEALKKFCMNSENEKDIINLKMSNEEVLSISSSQIVMRNKSDDINLIRERFAILSSFFNRNNEQELKLFSKSSYRIVIGSPLDHSIKRDQNIVRHTFGGVMEDNPPQCINCHRPLHFLAKIDMEDPKLKTKAIGTRFLYIITCLNCEHSSVPLFIEYSDKMLRVIRQEKGETFNNFPAFLEKREITLIKDPKSTARGIEFNESRHKLGGSPDWIQSDEIPVCPKCNKGMQFIAQLETDNNVDIQFGDNGILYAFICIKCKVIATFMQYH